jgi:hypothetical protein
VNAKFGMEFTVLGDMCFLVGMASLFLLPDRQGQVLSLLAVCALFGVGILLSLFRGVALMNRMAKEKGLRQ